MPRRIETHMLAGPAGRLEALLEEPEDREPREAALVCHPHPRYGGTMQNKVVYRLARGLRRTGAVVLRFNFRGVNLSEGSYDEGNGEVEDARTALSWLRSRYPGLPFSLAGFSFGSQVILRLGCTMEDAGRLIAVGLPTSYFYKVDWGACKAPKIFIQSTEDEYGPVEDLQSFYETLRPPKQLHWVAAKDHFFAGALAEFEETVFRLGSLR